jgi:hypothetical protein
MVQTRTCETNSTSTSAGASAALPTLHALAGPKATIVPLTSSDLKGAPEIE